MRGYGLSGATSALVRESLPKIGRRKYSERSVNRVLSENSSKWFGPKPFYRTQSVGPTGEKRVSYVSQEFLNARKPFGHCYLTGEKKFPYEILASRFSHTKKAMLFRAAMPLCLGESTLRNHISGRKRVVRTGVVVISMDSGEKRKKSPSSSSSSSNSTTSTVSNAKKEENRSSVERKAKAETRKADETKSKEKKGFLQKRGGNIFRKSWHKRYVVLKEGSIYYYTSNRKNERCRGSYSINKSCTVQVCVCFLASFQMEQ